MKECVSRTIVISASNTGLSLASEDKVKVIKMTKYETAEQEIEDSPIGQVKIRFSMLFIIDRLNQIKIEDLPALNHNDDHKCQKRSN